MIDPPEPDADEEPDPPRPLLGWTFWAGLGFALACVLLGVVVGLWGSRLAPPRPAHAPTVLPAAPAAEPARTQP